jgi:Fe-S oxidoreductase
MLSEFLVNEGWAPPKLERRALVHAHCHHRSVLDYEAEEELLDAIGLDYERPDSGCCGMAGSFGFEAGDKYEVGKAAGERVLLPEVRKADDDALIVTDGFSCRTMIEQETDRRALHIAEVLKMAIDQGPGGPTGIRPEDAVDERTVPGHRPSRTRHLIPAGIVAGAAVLVALGIRRRRD